MTTVSRALRSWRRPKGIGEDILVSSADPEEAVAWIEEMVESNAEF
jgi:hypothetical protein